MFARRTVGTCTEIPDIYIGWPFPNILTSASSIYSAKHYIYPFFFLPFVLLFSFSAGFFPLFFFVYFFSFYDIYIYIFYTESAENTTLFIDLDEPFDSLARRFPIYFTMNFIPPIRLWKSQNIQMNRYQNIVIIYTSILSMILEFRWLINTIIMVYIGSLKLS